MTGTYMKHMALVISAVSVFVPFQACGPSEKPSVPDSDSAPVAKEDRVVTGTSGEEIYKRTCMACHQASGEGLLNAFPPLSKSDFLSNRAEVIRQVIEGKSGEMAVNGVKYNGIMPPQALDDDEIAAVLTYVYSSWGNTGEPVTAEEVRTERARKL